MSYLKKFGIIISLVLSLYGQQSSAQSTEERFQDVFITAGYATAFGAALGAASLSFLDSPQDHLQYIAVGASLGFIGGSLLGTYMVVAPAMAEKAPQGSTLLADHTDPNRITIRPIFSNKTGQLLQFESAFTLARW